ASLDVLGTAADDAGEERHRFRRLARLEVDEGEGTKRAPRLDRGRRGATVRHARERELPLRRLKITQEQPTFQEGGAIVAFRDLELALAQAGLGGRDGRLESR